MNNVVLTGRLTKDIEVRTTPQGKSVAMFSIAVDDGYGDNKKTYFHNVVVWGKTAENMAQYTHKGSKVAVSGKLASRSYTTDDGKKHYVTEVIADQYGGIEFLDPRKNSSAGVGNEIQEEEIPF